MGVPLSLSLSFYTITCAETTSVPCHRQLVTHAQNTFATLIHRGTEDSLIASLREAWAWRGHGSDLHGRRRGHQ